MPIDALRALQSGAPEKNVRNHFAVEADGSFMLDTLGIEAAGVLRGS